MKYRLTALCMMASALTGLPALAQTTATTPPAAQSSTPADIQPVGKQDFVKNAAIGGMFEIETSRLALQKSKDQDVQQVAHRMITDHTKADEQLKTLAQSEKLTVPTSLDEQHKSMLDKLKQANGSDFADQFKQMQVSAHEQAVDLFKNYAQDGKDSRLKQFAQQTLPTLQEHLQMVQKIDVASNGNNGSAQPNTMGQNTTATTGANDQAANSSTSNQPGQQQFLTTEAPDMWRASKMMGIGVYNEQNQKIGTINEMLFNKSGQVSAVVIGIGGFLGIGERYVAVPYDMLKWSMTPPNGGHLAATGNPSGTTGTAGPALGAAPPSTGAPPTATTPRPMTGMQTASNNTASTNSNGPAAYPDHAILPNASKAQLDQAPQFKWGSAPK